MILGFYGRTFKETAIIPPENFELWEKRAIAEINCILARDISQNLDDNAKMCICEVAEALYGDAKRSGIQSESTDGYSVHFDTKNRDTKILKIVKKWFSGSSLLYRGDVLC